MSRPLVVSRYRIKQGKYEHRLIMETLLGRSLLRAEHVHHINGDKWDNRPENLVLLTQAEHHKEHTGLGIYGPKPILPVTKTCVICGVEFRPATSRRRSQQVCGRNACMSSLLSQKAKEREQRRREYR